MMTTIDSRITPGVRVHHEEYGNGTVESVNLNAIYGDGSAAPAFASVTFDSNQYLLPSLDSLTVIGEGVAIPAVPAFAVLVAYLPARPTSRHGIRPVALHHFNIDGEGPFVVADGELYMPCHRCGGVGEFSQNMLDGTMCYGCNGDGLGKPILWTDAQRIAARRSADRARKAAAALAERHAEALTWNAFRSGNEDVIAFLAPMTDRSGFLGDMARKVADLTPLSTNMLAAVGRIMGDRAQQTETRQAAGHVGTVGKREVFEVRVLNVRPIENEYGTSYLVIMETRDGAAVKTFGSGAWASSVEAAPDTFISVKGTVKAHDEYQGTPQTVLTRVAAA